VSDTEQMAKSVADSAGVFFVPAFNGLEVCDCLFISSFPFSLLPSMGCESVLYLSDNNKWCWWL